MQKHEITEYQKHALPYPRSRYRTVRSVGRDTRRDIPSARAMHSRDKQRVQTGAAPLRRRSCVHAYGRPTPCTRSHTKAAGREHSGVATRVAFTRTFVDYNRHFGPAPFIPAAALPVPVDVDHCAHTHICARRPQGECSQHERQADHSWDQAC